jgi:anti-sigma factor RsiW
MTVTRDIVIDLLPLYASGEASADTRAAVEAALDKDASLRQLLSALAEHGPLPEHEVPDSVEREAVNRTRRAIAQRSWSFGLALLFTLLPLTIVVRDGEVTFFMLRNEPRSMWFWAGAALLWVNYLRLSRRISSSGL